MIKNSLLTNQNLYVRLTCYINNNDVLSILKRFCTVSEMEENKMSVLLILFLLLGVSIVLLEHIINRPTEEDKRRAEKAKQRQIDEENQKNLIRDFENSEFTRAIYNELSKSKGQIFQITINLSEIDYQVANGYSLEQNREFFDSYSIVFCKIGYENLNNFDEAFAFCDALANKLGKDYLAKHYYWDTDNAAGIHVGIQYKYKQEYRDKIKSQLGLKKTH